MTVVRLLAVCVVLAFTANCSLWNSLPEEKQDKAKEKFKESVEDYLDDNGDDDDKENPDPDDHTGNGSNIIEGSFPLPGSADALIPIEHEGKTYYAPLFSHDETTSPTL